MANPPHAHRMTLEERRALVIEDLLEFEDLADAAALDALQRVLRDLLDHTEGRPCIGMQKSAIVADFLDTVGAKVVLEGIRYPDLGDLSSPDEGGRTN